MRNTVELSDGERCAVKTEQLKLAWIRSGCLSGFAAVSTVLAAARLIACGQHALTMGVVSQSACAEFPFPLRLCAARRASNRQGLDFAAYYHVQNYSTAAAVNAVQFCTAYVAGASCVAGFPSRTRKFGIRTSHVPITWAASADLIRSNNGTHLSCCASN
jgi:hypothetical protein